MKISLSKISKGTTVWDYEGFKCHFKFTITLGSCFLEKFNEYGELVYSGDFDIDLFLQLVLG